MPIFSPPLGVTHKFSSAKADGADATLVRPSNWNDQHNLNWGWTEQDFGSTPTYFGSWVITGADIVIGSRILLALAAEAPAALRDGVSADGDEADMEPMYLFAEAITAGQFTLCAEVIDGPVTGPYKFIYQAG